MRIIHSTGWEDGTAALYERLVSDLAGGKTVLWLTSGGSNIPATVQIMNNISANLTFNLIIMPADERYGPLGHQNSNWAQLMRAGLAAKKAKLLPVLVARKTFQQTITYYRQLVNKTYETADSIIAQLGIGEDGHLAGILPDSPAAKEKKYPVVGYDSPPYRRLTLTFPALSRVNSAFVFAYGENKRQALQSLESQNLAISKQPAQILKQLPDACIYSDQIGEIL